jgi:hypothetical protein
MSGSAQRQPRGTGVHRKSRTPSEAIRTVVVSTPTGGVHRAPRKRSALTRTAAVGGAVVCIGMAYELGAPTADALSMVIPLGDGNGTGNTLRINILEGNILNPQLGIARGNVSNNSTIGGVGTGSGNDTRMTSDGSSTQTALGAAAGNGNEIQVNILSFNIFNPQVSIGGNNVSNNTTISNVAMGNGNNSSTQMVSSSDGLWGGWLSAITGNGNTTQFALLSGNIFNPQWSFGGENISNNTAATNIAAGNGNGSKTTMTAGGALGTALLGFMKGNGNTTQTAALTTNIYNPQMSTGGNTSNNEAVTNDAQSNGNNSGTDVGTASALGSILTTGATGNGNTTQNANGSGNIVNNQVSGGISRQTRTTTTTAPGATGSFTSRLTAAVNSALGTNSTTTALSNTSNTSSTATSSTTGASGATGHASAGSPGKAGGNP